MYKKILIATDGSELAQRGIDHGLSLAKTLGATVLFVTVTEPLASVIAHRGYESIGAHEIERFRQHGEEAAKKVLDSAKSKADAVGVEADTMHLDYARPAEGILAAASERDCSLLVMTSHGRRGFGRLLLGSQTVDVLTHSRIPVLVIK